MSLLFSANIKLTLNIDQIAARSIHLFVVSIIFGNEKKKQTNIQFAEVLMRETFTAENRCVIAVVVILYFLLFHYLRCEQITQLTRNLIKVFYGRVHTGQVIIQNAWNRTLQHGTSTCQQCDVIVSYYIRHFSTIFYSFSSKNPNIEITFIISFYVLFVNFGFFLLFCSF